MCETAGVRAGESVSGCGESMVVFSVGAGTIEAPKEGMLLEVMVVVVGWDSIAEWQSSSIEVGMDRSLSSIMVVGVSNG